MRKFWSWTTDIAAWMMFPMKYLLMRELLRCSDLIVTTSEICQGALSTSELKTGFFNGNVDQYKVIVLREIVILCPISW